MVLVGKVFRIYKLKCHKKIKSILCTFNCRFEQSEMDRWHLSNHPQVRCAWCYGSKNWIFAIKVQVIQGRDDVYDSSFLFSFYCVWLHNYVDTFIPIPIIILTTWIFFNLYWSHLSNGFIHCHALVLLVGFLDGFFHVVIILWL